MSPLDLSTVELSLLNALDDLRVSQGGPVRTLRGIGVPWPAARYSSALALPAVLVRYLGRTAPTPGAGQLGGWLRWGVVVAVGGGRGESARRAGTPPPFAGLGNAGAWPILERIRARLTHLAPFSGCGPLMLHAEEPGGGDPSWAVWEQTWQFSLPAEGSVRPLMALATDGPETLTPAVPGAALDIDVGADASLFTVGDPLFLASFSGDENSHLGPIIAVVDTTLHFERPPARDYPANSLLWSPGACHQWSTGRFPGTADTWDRGTELLRVGDGDALAMRLHIARRSTSVGLGPIPASEIASFRSWLETNTRGGVEPFTWVDERGAVARARVQSPSCAEHQTEAGLLSIRFELALDAPGSRA